MNLREFVQAAVDADVECGAQAPVMVQGPDDTIYQIKAIEIEAGQSFEGNTESGPTVWVKIEEY